ncbi:MAG: ATP-binding protein, partial [Marmoricola sp.]
VIWLTTLGVGITVRVVAFAGYFTVGVQTMKTMDDSLREGAAAAAQSQTLDTLSAAHIPPGLLGAADIKIIFLDGASGIARSVDDGPIPGLGHPELAVARGNQDYSARTVWSQGVQYRMVAVPAGKHQALVLAQSLGPTDRMLDRLGLVLLLFGLAGVIIAGLAGWTVATNGLRPLRRLTRAVEDIARTERLEPIPVESHDEIGRLSVSFNRLLATVSASQERQRQLVADAGHELRTPLTSLRTNLDLLVQAGDTLPAAQRRELLDDVRAQIAELTTLVGDLVELARDEPVAPTVEPVELSAVVAHALERVRRRATDTARDFDVDTEPWWIVGEEPALERAVANLLDNAVKWSPPGGIVRVHLSEGTLMVSDAGKGIAARDLPHVFDRFYRSTESRGMPGSGLGLSIVRAVAERHNGTVRAGTGPDDGAAFWLSLPGTPQPPDDGSDGPSGRTRAGDGEQMRSR